MQLRRFSDRRSSRNHRDRRPERAGLAAVDPAAAKVVIDNDQVRVLEVLHKPGVKEPMHSHPAYVSVHLGSSKVRLTLPEGTTFFADQRKEIAREERKTLVSLVREAAARQVRE